MRIFHDVSGDVASGEAYRQPWIQGTIQEYPGVVLVPRTVEMQMHDGHFEAIDEADAVIAEFNAPDDELQQRIIYASMVGKRVLVVVNRSQTPHQVLDRFPVPAPSKLTSDKPAKSYWLKDDVYHGREIAVYYAMSFGKDAITADARIRNWMRSQKVMTDAERRIYARADLEEDRIQKQEGVDYTNPHF
jgi:hypothetical protein